MKKNTAKKTATDLDLFSRNSEKEGFCLLHNGQGRKKTEIYENPVKKMPKLLDEMEKSMIAVGYLAYPNVRLKNIIPNQRFYIFKESESLFHKTGEKIYKKLENYKTLGKLIPSVNKNQYIHKIKEIKKLLKAGEIYQLNYAIRFRKKFEGHPYALFLKWIELSPSPFAAFLNCGDYQILSNSPERLFSMKNRFITAQPIKGTAAKNKNPEKALAQLMASQKERAELDMITDLARNDIGQICDYGTLKLKKNRVVLELSNLWHTYSEVVGRVGRKIGINEIIKAMFPGGSITGCPKKRAMEYIEKLEALPRNIFTGSIGYIKNSGSGSQSIEADFNICIRTALIKDGYIEYWAGGGIMADSDPEAEYQECLLKAEAFLSIL